MINLTAETKDLLTSVFEFSFLLDSLNFILSISNAACPLANLCRWWTDGVFNPVK